MGWISVALLTFLPLFSSAFATADRGYVITTPRRWMVDAPAQVCVTLTEGTLASGDLITVTVAEVENEKKLLSQAGLSFLKGLSNVCQSITVPSTEDDLVNVKMDGILAGITVSENVNITVVQSFQKTIIQTDKSLYKPGQKVQFRILSLKGPNLNVNTNPYEQVSVHSPSNTRIQQWLNVDNSDGLVHLSFELPDEVEEGIYTIFVKKPHQNQESTTFTVQDYVLPRYDVTIHAPTNILGSDATVTIKLCAKYTYGEPVQGNATLSLAAGSWKIYENVTQNKQISGCEDFTFETNKLRFDDNNCHINIHNLIADALVVESGTDVKLYGRKDNIVVHREAVKFRDESPSSVAKAYLPFSVKIAATYPNGESAKNEIMEVCTTYEEENFCKNFTTNKKGYLNFMSSQSTARIEVRAIKYPRIEKNFNVVMEESKFYKYRYRSEMYLDPSNSSLTIFVAEVIKCTTGEDVNVRIPVVYVSSSSQGLTDVFVQVMARGQVKYLNKTEVKFENTKLPFQNDDLLIPMEAVPVGVVRGTFFIPLILPPTVAPKFKILVWYKTSSGVVVADSKQLEVSSCLPHKVDLSWSSKKGEPGSEVNLLTKGVKNAICGIGVVDKSVELLSSQGNSLNIDTLMRLYIGSEVSSWDSNQLNLEYCLKKYKSSSLSQAAKASGLRDGVRSIPFTYHGLPEMEALHMFNNAGYYVLSNLVLENEFCNNQIIKALKSETETQSFELHSLGVHDSDMSTRLKSVHRAPSSGPYPQRTKTGPPGAQYYDVVYSPDKQEEPVEEAKERNYLPETWLWLLQPLSTTGESSNTVTLPDTITEWIGRAVCVHPNEGIGISCPASIKTFTPFFVDLTMPATMARGEILPLKISVFNYLEEAIPVKVLLKESADYEYVSGEGAAETGKREVCIPPKSKSVQTIKMKFKTLGDVNITVEAYIEALSSAVCGSGTPPKKRDRLIRSLPIEAEGYLRETIYTNYICSQDETNVIDTPNDWHIIAPSGIVEGSARAWITATGDLMGPTVDNLGSLVRMPSGCGEQNMVNFAPNIYILQYLDASKQTTEFIRDKITRLLSQGYQRQLLFKHESDGSFSAFGKKDSSGSTWLTAFVVKSFAQARPYTFIDPLTQSIIWLKMQQKENGCFRSVGRVVNKMLEGGISGSEGSESLLTAYVLAALLEAGDIADEASTTLALACIQKDTSSHPYNLGLKGYALALAKSPIAKTVIDQLVAVSVSNSSDMRWDISDGKDKNTALHVETAAYALLAMVTHGSSDYTESARKVVRWISGLRNGQGGFVSTQDTVVALQALAAFEKSQPSPILNMIVKTTADSLVHEFTVTEDTKFLQQRVDLPRLPANVKFTSSGQGCAVLQGVLRYNVHDDSLNPAFVLDLTVAPSVEKDCKTYNISACTKYTLPDGNSNMALIEIKLVSGYVPLKQDLKGVVGNGKGSFKRYEVNGRNVIFYLDKVNSTNICATFRAYQEVEIEQPKQGSVSVYDYYQPEFITTEKFNFTPDASCKS